MSKRFAGALFGFILPLFALLLPSLAFAATLSLGGPSGATVGGTFNVPVYLSTAPGESANAVSGTVTFPSGLLSLVAISKAGSVINLWPSEPTQDSNSMHFEGVILNPGYSGQGGTVVTLTFQAKAAGSAPLAFDDASVLANDGNATPILTSASPKTVTIQGASPSTPATNIVITSSTHPNQNVTYKQPDVSLDWTLDANATSVRIGYDKDPQGRPTVVYDASTRHKDITLKDGTWYFHVQDMVNGTWSSVASYRIKISSTAPVVPETPVTPVETATTSTTTDIGSVVPVETPAVEASTGGLLGFVLDHWLLAILLILLLAALVFILERYLRGYPWLFGRKRSKKSIAHAHLHEQFEELRDALTEEMFALQHAKTKRQLTDEEERFLSRFDRLLNKVENTIERDMLK